MTNATIEGAMTTQLMVDLYGSGGLIATTEALRVEVAGLRQEVDRLRADLTMEREMANLHRKAAYDMLHTYASGWSVSRERWDRLTRTLRWGAVAVAVWLAVLSAAVLL